jgi:molecular chaperone DnaK (HSP70)
MEREGDDDVNTKKKIHFVIGDFAGVENTFKCEDKTELKKLMNIGSRKITADGKIESNYVPLTKTVGSVEPDFEYDLDTVNMVLNDTKFNFNPIVMPTLDNLDKLVKEYNTKIQDLYVPENSTKVIDLIYKEISQTLKNNDLKSDEFKNIIQQLKPLYNDINKLKYGEKLPNEKAHMWSYNGNDIHIAHIM